MKVMLSTKDLPIDLMTNDSWKVRDGKLFHVNGSQKTVAILTSDKIDFKLNLSQYKD